MGQPLLAPLTSLGARSARTLRLHQLVHHPAQRLAQEVEPLLALEQVTTCSAVILFVSAIVVTPLVVVVKTRRSLSATVAGLRPGSVRRAVTPRCGT